MKLNDLIATMIKTSRKNTTFEGGLILLTVDQNAEPLVRLQLPDAMVAEPNDRGLLRTLREDSVRDRTDWPRVVVWCHNPHISLGNEADIVLHVWKDGDDVKVRCEKFRSLMERPSDVWTLGEEATA